MTGCSVWVEFLNFTLSLTLGGTSGFRATVPLFLVSLLHNTNGIELWDQVEWLGDPSVTAFLGVFVATEILVDMVPGADNCTHAFMTLVHPILGFLAAVAPVACSGWSAAAPVGLMGGGMALAMHAGKASVRAASTVGSAGCCNPIISIAETCAVFIIIVICVLFAVLSIIAATLLVVATSFAAYKLWQRRQSKKKQEKSNEVHNEARNVVVQAVPVVQNQTQQSLPQPPAAMPAYLKEEP